MGRNSSKISIKETKRIGKVASELYVGITMDTRGLSKGFPQLEGLRQVWITSSM